ncbi:MAG: choice-of-anchor I family protein [Desulfotomaculum sp.]|nr:choice-of-anchor I family protein [Desulfotomaculum sp.]
MFRIKSTHRLLAVLLAVLMMVTTIPVGLLGIGKAEAVESDMTMYHQETSSIAVELIARYDSGSGEGGAEIVAYDQKSNRAYITNGTEKAIDIVDLSTLNDPSGEITLFQRIKAADLPLLGSFTANDITSVAVHPDGTYVAATVSADPETDKGRVVLLDQDGEFIKYFETGYLPDMLAFTPNGNKILVANEGEPNDAYTIDPVGSVSIIDLANGHENATVTDVGFGGLDGKIDADVRIFGGTDPTPEKDLEPEYIVVSADGATAYVVLQENNAVAELDIATKTFTRVHAFGFKDHSIRGNELDASNKDEAINIRNWPVLGMYQPDGIDIFTANGKNYLVTANEGDARDYDGFSEEKRVAKIKDDISLNAANYQGYTQDQIDQLVADGLFNEENLGRLKITTTLGKTGDNYEALYSYSTRSFSIWEMGNGSMEQVFDSGSDFEEIIADNIRWYFNHDDNEKDARSDDKGPEPEDVVIGTVGGKQYAFIGLECMGGVMVYDVSDPQNAKFETYFTSHNFDTIADGDWSPEGLNFVPAYQSLTGVALLLVAHEKSGTVAVYELQAQQAQEQQKITIIHTNDFHGRAASFDRPGVEGTIGGLDRITTIVKEERAKGQPLLVLDAGDTIHGTNLANLNQGKPVIEVMNEIGYAAMAVGNHEFNFGMAVLEQRAEQAEFPFLAANVRYKNGDPVPFFEPYTIIEAGDTTVGVIGLATTDTPTTTHPDNVAELEFLDPVAVTKDIVAQIKDQVDLIVLLAHMDFEDEQKVLDAVPGIAIAISGHTHQLRADIRDDGAILLAGGEHGRILGQLDVISPR